VASREYIEANKILELPEVEEAKLKWCGTAEPT
jgi:hypothetical protein